MRRVSDTVKSNAVAVVGICKNAGKTTVLNTLIEDMRGDTLGITSIGRDGESVDVATSTPKPRVYVCCGTIFATASELLPLCDATLEILDTSGIFTPLGEVVIVRARSDGNIQIAGPSTIEGLHKIHEQMKGCGAERMLFDGAISRKSLSVPSLCREIILCSGASYSASMSITVEDTAFFARLFKLDTVNDFEDKRKCTVVYESSVEGSDEIRDMFDYVKKNRSVKSIRIRGAITDTVLKQLLDTGVRNFDLVADDPSKLLISAKIFEKCEVRGIRLNVTQRARLAAVTVNPFSAYGMDYDARRFFDSVTESLQGLSIPVFDVKGDYHEV